jgi:Protein of unknown function (DUF3237)
MDNLTLLHLMTLTLDVDFRGLQRIGATPAGQRGVAQVTGGRFEGERLSGRVLGGADWFAHRDASVMTIDVRLTLEAEVGGLIYLAYQGRLLAAPEAMARFRKGEQLAANDYSLATTAKFETGHDGLRWLNDIVAVGIGEQLPTGPVYRIYQVG